MIKFPYLDTVLWLLFSNCVCTFGDIFFGVKSGRVCKNLSKRALSSALARRNGAMDADLALLAGLLHEIGKIPILEMATRREDLWSNPGLLEDILEGLAPMISAATLRQWQLPEALVQAARHQHNFAYDHNGECDLTDVLLVAHILSLAQAGERSQLPRLDETPSFSRITQQQLTPSESAQVLLEVQQQTGELKQLLA